MVARSSIFFHYFLGCPPMPWSVSRRAQRLSVASGYRGGLPAALPKRCGVVVCGLCGAHSVRLDDGARGGRFFRFCWRSTRHGVCHTALYGSDDKWF